MYKTTEKIIFILLFLGGLYLPMMFMNRKTGVISETENRTLASPAQFYDSNGLRNLNYTQDYERWFNDNLGFRAELAEADSNIQYRVFHQLNNMPLGKNGVLAPYDSLDDLQHRNLYTEDQAAVIVNAYQTAHDFLASQGIQMYYMQCWDKNTIYPEQYPDSITVFGDLSRTEQVENALISSTDIHVIPLQEVLFRAKEEYPVFSEWSDPWHWTPRGAFIAYQELISKINEYNDSKYRELTEEDFDITVEDCGKTYFRSIHKPEMLEVFQIKDPQYTEMRDRLTYQPPIQFERHMEYMVNPTAGNDDTLLIIGDSYIHDSMIFLTIASSFGTTVMFNGAAITDDSFIHMVEEYEPDIVLFENAERSVKDTFPLITKTANILAAPNYVIGTPIRFSEEENSGAPYVMNGMDDPSGTSAWTVGKKCTLFLRPENAEAGVPMTMDMKIDNVSSGSQDITVWINNQKAYEGTVEGEDTVSIPFELQDPRFLTVRIEIPNAVSPLELGDSTDTRELGLAVREITITQ